MGSSSREPAFYEVPWIRTLLSLCVVLLVIAALIEAYRKAEQYAGKVVKKEFNDAGNEKITLTAKLTNRPSWLDKSIVDQIFQETQNFAARDQATYDRLLNPLDHDILQEIAANYTGIDAKGVNHWTLRNNAWIKCINAVRRVMSADRKSETIQIDAEFRQPAAWVQYNEKFYLVDTDAIRLPGEYSVEDRKATAGLMAIDGVQLPLGAKGVPQPSEAWRTDDLAAGMKVVDLLRGEAFVAQIAAVDMANFQGRKDDKLPWILLDTILNSADAKPRVVNWGRPIGEENFREVKAVAKLKALNAIYTRFSRIDADRDYVDIRWDEVRLPKLAAEGDAIAPPVTPKG